MADKKTKAIFLDRDGTLIEAVDFLLRTSQLHILPGVPHAIKEFNNLGFLVVIVSNQPVISRGLISTQGIRKIHKVLLNRLKKRDAVIDAVYICPHHPDSSIKKYRQRCFCRKPEPGMILSAMKRFRIDPRKSFMIGDALIDIVAGKRAKLKTILVKTGPGHPRLDRKYNVEPDFVAKDLRVAAKIIRRDITSS